MIQVWIYYPTVSQVLYESWSMSDSCGWPYRPHHDHKLSQTLLVVTLYIGSKSLNNDPNQWYSNLRRILQVWICYPTISWVCYESWSTFDRGGSSHRPPHDYKPHLRDAQLLPWIFKPRAWTMLIISGAVVQGWWFRYGYGIPPVHDCYMSHEICLPGLDQVLDHHMTTIYTPDMLDCYPDFRNKELESWS